MKEQQLTPEMVEKFKVYLEEEERSEHTIKKYLRDIRKFQEFAGTREVTKDVVVSYKKSLIDQKYAARSVNSMLSAINSFFLFLGMGECCVKTLRLQRRIYCSKEEEFVRPEYWRLLKETEEGSRLYMVLQTLCGTGIRISELSFFTVEVVEKGEVTVTCKNKTRVILLTKKLQKMLLKYCREHGIESGIIFRTRSGKPVDRSNIWREMKKLCEKADVDPRKVYPHNFRKLFARTFYNKKKDIAKLADILGHSSIETTRIYIMTTAEENRKDIEEMNLVV